MPSKPPRICACGKRVSATQRCECQINRERERKARHDANRPTASQRGYGTKWRAARATFLEQNPTCLRCGAPATIVDHIIPHRGDLTKRGLFWNRRNWQPLCKPCHDRAKQSEEKSAS